MAETVETVAERCWNSGGTVVERGPLIKRGLRGELTCLLIIKRMVNVYKPLKGP